MKEFVLQKNNRNSWASRATVQELVAASVSSKSSFVALLPSSTSSSTTTTSSAVTATTTSSQPPGMVFKMELLYKEKKKNNQTPKKAKYVPTIGHRDTFDEWWGSGGDSQRVDIQSTKNRFFKSGFPFLRIALAGNNCSRIRVVFFTLFGETGVFPTTIDKNDLFLRCCAFVEEHFVGFKEIAHHVADIGVITEDCGNLKKGGTCVVED